MQCTETVPATNGQPYVCDLERGHPGPHKWMTMFSHRCEMHTQCTREDGHPGDHSHLIAPDYGKKPPSDPVNHPSHYQGTNGIEAIDVIEGFGLSHHLGDAVAYILRAGKKAETSLLQDLQKARWYLEREITRIESDTTGKEF